MMSARSLVVHICAAVALGLIVSRGALGQTASERPLPDATVTTTDGAPVSIRSLAGPGQWVIVYVHATAPASGRLIEALTTWELNPQARLLVIAGNVADARPLADKWSAKLPGARFAADPGNVVLGALQLRGAPSVVGLRGQSIVWVLAGVLNDPGMLKDVISSWTK